ncbi:group II intron maturase-specific domain-containing protein [Candidatus Accumulibacter contiguus]|jgi:RNA-directed DNA polymerase|uniref:group II intron maturase-specific domain-containing protein n=1 Tax=Candidatus Accumulibacter contiguus TaxID=2954381 RepID=UPI002FC3DE32
MTSGHRNGQKPLPPTITVREHRNIKSADRTHIPLRDIVGSLNRSLRGWANYFHYRNSSLSMNKVRNHAEDRLRTHLMKRHQVKDRGTGFRRLPSAHLYGRYRLYKVPTKAGWHSAHALA